MAIEEARAGPGQLGRREARQRLGMEPQMAAPFLPSLPPSGSEPLPGQRLLSRTKGAGV